MQRLTPNSAMAAHWFAALLVASAALVARAQNTPPREPATTQAVTSAPATQPVGEVAAAAARELTVESVQAQITKLEAATGMDEALRGRLLEACRATLAHLNDAAAWSAKADEFIRKRQNGPKELEDARARLQAALAAASQPASQPADEITSETTLEQAESLAASEEAALAQRRTDFDGLDDEARARADRRAAIPKRTVEISQQLEALALEINSPAPTGQPAELTMAQRDLAIARKRALEQEAASYQEELRLYDATSESLTQRRDLARLRREQAEKRSAAMQQALHDLRVRNARLEAEAATKALEELPGPLRELAEANRKLAAARSEMLTDEERVLNDRDRARAEAAELSRRLKSAQAKVNLAGLTNTVGTILRRERSHLPDVTRLQREVRASEKTISNADIQVIDLEDRRAALTADTAADRSSTDANTRLMRASGALEARVRELNRVQLDLVTRYHADLERYSHELTELNTEKRRLIATTVAYQEYIDENVFWIRSAPPLHEWQSPQDVTETLLAVVRDGYGALWQGLLENPAWEAGLLLLFLLLLLMQRRLRARLHAIGQLVHGLYTDSFRLTLEALLITVLIAAPWPALVGLVGWRILSAGELTRAAEATGGALVRSALLWGLLAFVRQTSRAHGVLQAHLDARPDGLAALRRNLNWAMPVLLSLIFIVSFCDLYGDERWRDFVGRGAFVLTMVALTVFVLRVFRPGGAVVQSLFRQRSDGWISRLRYLWYGILAGTPLVMLVLAWAGYYYTALQFQRRIFATVVFLSMLFLINALLVRWLYVAQRRLALEQMRKKRAAEEKTRGADEQSATDAAARTEHEVVNVAAISTQTRHLLRTAAGAALLIGAWLIWYDIFPAFNFLKNVTLWTHSIPIAGAGGVGGAALMRAAPITLADVALGLLVLTVMVVLSKNIPGALEITILQRLPLERSARYAITSVSRYLIVMIGLIVAFGSIGIGWSEVQWLAAAITVGLGFGLNEIFANFVSGLIILFERPVRVGDTISVTGVTGKVTQIRMRATHVMDWDRKEHIIPNRQFISSEVTNWTLTDPSVRLLIQVGVAYGSDISLVQKLLVQSTEQNPSVLQQPRPQAYLVRFGESSLDFQLSAVLRDTVDEPRARHEVHESIDAAFRRAGIEIAYPHRDIRVLSEPGAPPTQHTLEAGGAERDD